MSDQEGSSKKADGGKGKDGSKMPTKKGKGRVQETVNESATPQQQQQNGQQNTGTSTNTWPTNAIQRVRPDEPIRDGLGSSTPSTTRLVGDWLNSNPDRRPNRRPSFFSSPAQERAERLDLSFAEAPAQPPMVPQHNPRKRTIGATSELPPTEASPSQTGPSRDGANNGKRVKTPSETETVVTEAITLVVNIRPNVDPGEFFSNRIRNRNPSFTTVVTGVIPSEAGDDSHIPETIQEETSGPSGTSSHTITAPTQRQDQQPSQPMQSVETSQTQQPSSSRGPITQTPHAQRSTEASRNRRAQTPSLGATNSRSANASLGSSALASRTAARAAEKAARRADRGRGRGGGRGDRGGPAGMGGRAGKP